ncbi:MAG: GTPase [Candidatus Nanoarchaeia archaeon]
MAIPHNVQMQLIKKRLKNKQGKSKIDEIEKIWEELPGYNTGPYGELKKWLKSEMEKTKTRSKVKHNEFFEVKKQGMRQFVLVGAPSVGKSSLIKAISGVQTKVAEYEFTTLRPIPAVVKINHAEVQIVDLPGLIQGAVDDIGGGRKLLAIVRNSDGILLMHDLTKPIGHITGIFEEIEKARIEKPLLAIGNKIDLADNLYELKGRFSNVVGVSAETGRGIKELKNCIWQISNLIRVFPRNEQAPMVLESGSTIEDFVKGIHRDLIKRFRWAKVKGKSVKFDNQQVSLRHKLEDNDVVELSFY